MNLRCSAVLCLRRQRFELHRILWEYRSQVHLRFTVTLVGYIAYIRLCFVLWLGNWLDLVTWLVVVGCIGSFYWLYLVDWFVNWLYGLLVSVVEKTQTAEIQNPNQFYQAQSIRLKHFKLHKLWAKLGKIEENWAKLGKTAQNWAKLGKTGQNWAKLGETGWNWKKNSAKLMKTG